MSAKATAMLLSTPPFATNTLTCPIRGAYYRQPAPALLLTLPIGAELLLVPEPGCPEVGHNDPNAIAIWLPLTTLQGLEPSDDLDSKLAGYGTDLESLKAAGASIQLGYIPKELAAKLELTGQTPATFTTSASGAGMVRFELET